jgi:ankyrin repeat domain-containing protein 50
MGDPLSISASVAGLLSLGIQVTQSLVTYYTAYQYQDSHVAGTTSRLEALLKALQSLSEALNSRRFAAAERALIAQVESSIRDCNDLILELQHEAEKLSDPSKSSLGTTIKTAGRRLAYPLRRSTLQKLDEDIGEIREKLSLALNALQCNDGRKVQEDLHDIKSVLELVRSSQASQEVQDWLKAPDATTNHRESCAKRHSSSGLWFVNGSAFTSWLEEDKSFLWLNGFAGCGKSILTSTAIQYTFRHRQSNPRIGIAFFYFSFNDSSKQDVSGFLRAVLLQLANQSNETQVSLAHLHDSYKSGQPPIPALLDCLRQAIPKFQDVYLVVDALDESPRHEARERVLEALAVLRNWSLRGLHILATSRDEIDIRESLAPSTNEEISMKNTDVNQDIEDFIRGYLERDRAMQKWSKYHSRIKSVLTAKAGGMYCFQFYYNAYLLTSLVGFDGSSVNLCPSSRVPEANITLKSS